MMRENSIENLVNSKKGEYGDRPYFVHTHTHTHTHTYVNVAEQFLRLGANNPPCINGGLNYV